MLGLRLTTDRRAAVVAIALALGWWRYYGGNTEPPEHMPQVAVPPHEDPGVSHCSYGSMSPLPQVYSAQTVGAGASFRLSSVASFFAAPGSFSGLPGYRAGSAV